MGRNGRKEVADHNADGRDLVSEKVDDGGEQNRKSELGVPILS